MNNKTLRNFQSFKSLTEQNPNVAPLTVRNVSKEKFSSLSRGTILLGKYVVKRRLEIKSGEATFFVCECDNKEFVTKVYNYEDVVKPEIIEKIKSLIRLMSQKFTKQVFMAACRL